MGISKESVSRAERTAPYQLWYKYLRRELVRSTRKQHYAPVRGGQRAVFIIYPKPGVHRDAHRPLFFLGTEITELYMSDRT